MPTLTSVLVFGITLLYLSLPELAIGSDFGCLLVVDFDEVLVRPWLYRLVTFLMETLYVDICIVILAVVSIYIRHRKHQTLSKCILTVAIAALVCREYAFYQFTFHYAFLLDPTDGDIDLGNMVENISIINSKVSLTLRNMSLRVVVAFSLVYNLNLWTIQRRLFRT
jgi:hypothetical protein